MNAGSRVNRAKAAGAERALLDKLGEILVGVGWLTDVRVSRSRRSVPDRPDATIELRLRKGGRPAAELQVYVKEDLRPSAFPTWAGQRRTHAPEWPTALVLAMPFVSPRVADLCRHADWSWLDLAGNCRIDVPGLLHVERTGIAPARRPPRPSANLGTAAAARVLRTLLSPANAGRMWTQRSLRAETCWRMAGKDEPVSLGLVNKVVRHLRDEGFLEDAGPGVRVRDAAGLLAAWNRAYRFDRHDRRPYFTLLKGVELDEALYRTGLEAGGMAAYAAFSAAERQAPHVRQPKTWLYVSADHLDALARHAQAKEVDSGENLVVLLPDDVGVFVSLEGESHVGERKLGSTDPVQTYVDLMHCGGRGEEAAQALLEQRLLPPWKAVEGA